jgi:acylphosphatase
MPTRYDIIFLGHVQGVGFRYAACRIADRFQVSGWVRNQRDGSVRCVVEGGQDTLDRFVKTVQDEMAGHIADTRLTRAPATGEFAGFTVER